MRRRRRKRLDKRSISVPLHTVKTCGTLPLEGVMSISQMCQALLPLTALWSCFHSIMALSRIEGKKDPVYRSGNFRDTSPPTLFFPLLSLGKSKIRNGRSQMPILIPLRVSPLFLFFFFFLSLRFSTKKLVSARSWMIQVFEKTRAHQVDQSWKSRQSRRPCGCV